MNQINYAINQDNNFILLNNFKNNKNLKTSNNRILINSNFLLFLKDNKLSNKNKVLCLNKNLIRNFKRTSFIQKDSQQVDKHSKMNIVKQV